MSETPSVPKTPPEPESASSEKTSIRKSQEEFIDDSAGASIDKSEYEQRKAEKSPPTQ